MSDSAPAHAWYALVMETIALKGMTKAQLSELSGIPRPTIERWATGKRTPQAAPVNAVADALSIDRRHALRLAGIVGSAPGRAPAIPPETLDWLRNGLPAEDYERVIKDIERGLRAKLTPAEEASSSGEDQKRAG